MKTRILMILSISVMTILVGCTYNPKNDSKAQHQDEVLETGKEYTSKFICPMHCKGSGSDIAGQCPTCGMDYVENPNYNKTEHTHYSCPMHPEVEGHKGDSCTKCGMELTNSKS